MHMKVICTLYIWKGANTNCTCAILYQNNVNKIKYINNCILINKEINVFGGKLGKGSVNLEPPSFKHHTHI